MTLTFANNLEISHWNFLHSQKKLSCGVKYLHYMGGDFLKKQEIARSHLDKKERTD